jgi:hypothetical protein
MTAYECLNYMLIVRIQKGSITQREIVDTLGVLACHENHILNGGKCFEGPVADLLEQWHRKFPKLMFGNLEEAWMSP